MSPLVRLGRLGPLGLGLAHGERARLPAPRRLVHAGQAVLRVGARMVVAPGEAVSAGPAYLGTHALLTDGAVYTSGPSLSLEAAHEWIVVWERAATGTHYIAAGYGAAGPRFEFLAVGASSLAAYGYNGTDYRISSLTAALTGLHVMGAGFDATGVATVWYDSTTGTGSSPGTPPATSTIYAGAFRNGSGLTPCAAGMKIREMALYTGGVLSGADRAALYASGTPGDLLARIATQPAHYYDMSNFYDSGAGVWKIRDLIDLTGASDLTVIAGDNTDFVAV